MDFLKSYYGNAIKFLLISFALHGIGQTTDQEHQAIESLAVGASSLVVHEIPEIPSVQPEDLTQNKEDEKEIKLSQEILASPPSSTLQETQSSSISSTPSLVELTSLDELKREELELEALIDGTTIMMVTPSTEANTLALESELKKEEEKPKRGVLSYRAEIDLDQINFTHLTRLISTHYELNIPLAFDFERVAEVFKEELKSRLEHVLTNRGPYFQGKRLRILSIDGGGVRGIIAARMLVEFEKRTGYPISQLFDIIVATSTGAIMAAGVTYPSKEDPSKPAYTAEDLLKLYMDQSAFIFSKKLQWIGMYGGKYSADPLISILKKYFGDSTLAELLNDTIFTAYSLTDRTGYVFSSQDARINPKKNQFIYDVLRASTAAPTYFNPHKIGKKIFCDGGLFLNNPVMLGILRGLEKYGKLPHEMEIVSLGTGCSVDVQTLTGYEGYSKLGWADELLNAFLDGSSQHFLAEDWARSDRRIHGLGGETNYRRFTVDLPKEHLDIDNYSPANLKSLIECIERKIKLWDADIEKICEKLKPSPEKEKKVRGTPFIRRL